MIHPRCRRRWRAARAERASCSSATSAAAFEAAAEYLRGFGAPFDIITGNHDLEGAEFDTDEANLAAWQAAFQRSHHWVRDVGPCVLVGLSTTRYRSNELSHHEVHIDAAQRAWFERILAAVGGTKPVIVFTHAPPMGCGLKVINSLHIKNRCALLRRQTWLQCLAPAPHR